MQVVRTESMQAGVQLSFKDGEQCKASGHILLLPDCMDTLGFKLSWWTKDRGGRCSHIAIEDALSA